MAYPYLEQFLDTLETLPAELQRNFTLMRDLDLKTQDLVDRIENDSSDYLHKVPKYNSSEKCDNVKGIVDMLDKAQELSEDKIQLAMQTYEMVDKHIRRLDSELSRLEAELKEKQLNLSAEEKPKKRSKSRDKKGQSFNPKNVIKEEVDKGRKRQKGGLLANNDSNVLALDSSALLGTEVLDMPVDPNEPTYCVCHQVSYGEMIGCDNLDCPIEWFHFGCVGLTQKPRGKWYCQKCFVDKKKGKN